MMKEGLRFVRLRSTQLLALFALGLSVTTPKSQEAIALQHETPKAQIKGGLFLPGATQDELAYASTLCLQEGGGTNCSPERFADELATDQLVMVQSFWLDRYEVSIAQFKHCLDRGSCQYTGEITGATSLPMTQVSFDEARQYCKAQSGDLPSELQFEFAASYAGANRFPWGNTEGGLRANWGQRGVGQYSSLDGHRGLATARSPSFDRTPHGIYHLAGNASEWTISSSPWSRQPSDEGRALMRGGHFRSPASLGRNYTRQRISRSRRTPYLGFRCAYPFT